MLPIEQVLRKNKDQFYPVVKFNKALDQLYPFNFTASNKELTDADIADTAKFSGYVEEVLSKNNCVYGIGGYGEDRVLYRRSGMFNETEPRTIHLGVDIWGPAGTEVFAPLGGMVHSFAFNKAFGDYGATIILLHQIDTVSFYTLYGHMSLNDIAILQEGNYINRGQKIGHFGVPAENGDWPPHLHFQVIQDIDLKVGDYPGVCRASEKEAYLANCPDPNLILNML
jgi:peptidoglycan LD-endopeptidase LytH